MNTQSYKTRAANQQTVSKQWWVLDATNLIVGRAASQIASLIRGKHKPYFTPHVDCGDNVVVINAEKIRFTGNKMKNKTYISHTGYPGGQRSTTPKRLRTKKPHYIIEHAVRGMLPKNRLGRQLFKNLFVYTGEAHPHAAQKPQKITL